MKRVTQGLDAAYKQMEALQAWQNYLEGKPPPKVHFYSYKLIHLVWPMSLFFQAPEFIG